MARLKVLLCGIGRQENKYIREWVEYNKGIGFTNIVLYDNNHDGEEDFHDSIGDYIESGYVILEDYRNKVKCQLTAYDDCYKKYGDKYDWIAFFDCDEFLEMDKWKNVTGMLADGMYKGYDVVCPCWMNYTDSGLVTVEDGNYSVKRFTETLKEGSTDNKLMKSIIRTGIEGIQFGIKGGNPHGMYSDKIKACNTKGEEIAYDKTTCYVMKNYTHDNARLNHYRYKTIEEFVDKSIKGYPDGNYVPVNLEYFWKYNEKTQEKIKLYKEKMKPYTDKTKVLLCAIGRWENKYINEWVAYHKIAGFDHIVLYDNNRDGEEHFEDAIGDYIKDGFVTLVDYRNRTKCQLQAYQECYDTYGKDYDWIAFLDCDEFLFFTNGDNVKTYLCGNRMENFDMVHVNWMCFDDNGKTNYEPGLLISRFPNPHRPLDFKRKYDFAENNHIKTIVRTGIKDLSWSSTPHTPVNKGIKCCTGDGLVTKSESPFTSKYYYSNIYIRHYTTKTIEEYVTNKMQRGFPDHDESMSKQILNLDYFWAMNEKTPEKEKLANELLDKIETKTKKRDDAKLYLMTYKPVDYALRDDKLVTPLQVGTACNPKYDICKYKDNSGKNISDCNPFYVENTGIYWIWKNVNDCKYKGQMGYRRLLNLPEDTDFDEIFKNHNCICAEPYIFEKDGWIPADTVEGGYKYSHNIEDLLRLEIIIKKVFPDYADDYDKYIKNGNKLFYSNGFVMKTEDYDKYCMFLFTCLEYWRKVSGVNDVKDYPIYVTRNLYKGKYPRYPKPDEVGNSTIKWQSEIGGFLSERLLTLFVLHNFKNIYTVEYDKKEDIPL